MPISIMQVDIEMFSIDRKSKVSCRDRILPTIRSLFSCDSGFRFVSVMLILLMCSDSESNPGSRTRHFCYNFLVCLGT